MGLDYDAVLVFGIVLTQEEAALVRDKYYNDDHGEYILPEDLFGGLFVGWTYPYPDADERVYISLLSHYTNQLSQKEMFELLSWNRSLWANFLEHIGISYREPELLCLPHIW